MTDLNSSVIFWKEEEIMPRSLLFMSSGAGGDRLLFWHPTTTSSNKGNGPLPENPPTHHTPSTNSTSATTTTATRDSTHQERASTSPFQKRHSSVETSSVPYNSPSSHHSSLQCPRGHSSPVAPTPGGHLGVSASSINVGSPSGAVVHSLSECADTTFHSHQQQHLLGSRPGLVSTVASGLQRLSANTPASAPTSALNTLGAGAQTTGPNSVTTPPAAGGGSNNNTATTTHPKELVIEGAAVSSLLSLLHPSTNDLQHKIYVKASSRVFVGVAFSVTKAAMETSDSPPPQTPQSQTSISTTARTPIISRRGSLHTVISASCLTVKSSSGSSGVSDVDPPVSIIDFLRLKGTLAGAVSSSGEASETRVDKTTVTQVSAAAVGAVACGGNGCARNLVNQSLTSFAIVFVLSEEAPPCVQSHYTELARLTGTQMCRSELYWQYLSGEREKIAAILDRHSGILGGNEGIQLRGDSIANASLATGPDDVGVDPSVPPVTFTMGSPSPLAETGISAQLMSSSTAAACKQRCDETPGPAEVVDGQRRSCTSACNEVYSLIAQRSKICAELIEIMDQVTAFGRVNVKINGRYPVFFCMPFKAYAIMPFGLAMTTAAGGGARKPCWPAIRPGAVWRAMQAIRPYHTLLLTTRKRFLHAYTDRFPSDANQSLERIILDFSTTSTISAMSSRVKSQEHCLRVALWLVYHGHAIIISPVLLANAYILAPLSNLWLQPKVLQQFAIQFPKLNFAEVLASFSEYYTIQEHLDGDSPARFWKTLNQVDVIDLITWLLRRRLIVQLHTYISIAAPVSELSVSRQQHPPPPQLSPPPPSPLDEEQEVAGVREEFALEQLCPEEVEQGLLYTALPSAHDRLRVLAHYRSRVQRAPSMLQLFLRLMRRLSGCAGRAAHLEELMFSESVDRRNLLTCVQMFSPFFVTLRLPDPVTACFAGIEWPN